MFCTQYKENLNYCLPSVLGNVEDQSGEHITTDEVMSLIAGKFTVADQAFISVPKVSQLSSYIMWRSQSIGSLTKPKKHF
jgi:hypothetical protein